MHALVPACTITCRAVLCCAACSVREWLEDMGLALLLAHYADGPPASAALWIDAASTQAQGAGGTAEAEPMLQEQLHLLQLHGLRDVLAGMDAVDVDAEADGAMHIAVPQPQLPASRLARLLQRCALE